jgi:hypothetical protein
MKPTGHRVKESQCPTCKKVLSAAAEIHGGNAQPKPGDLSVCFYCGSFIRFMPDMQLRLMTIEEIAEWDDNTRIAMMRMRQEALEFRESHRQRKVAL